MIDMTIEDLLSDYNWAEVFADKSSGNTTKDTEAIGICLDTPPNRIDVVEILASRQGDNDGPDWLGVFKLIDGRYLFAEGGCDYTGWD